MSTTTRKLSLSFLDTNDEKYTQSWANVKAAITGTEVVTFANTIITNRAIFSKAPNTLLSATMTTTTTTPIDISD